jgi:hypothetical protein
LYQRLQCRDKYFFKIKFVFFLYLWLLASSKENDLPLCIYFWYQTDSGVSNTSIYSAETTVLELGFMFRIDMCSVYTQVKLIMISYIGTLFQVQFIQDSTLFRVQFIQDSTLFRVQFIQDSTLFRVRFRQIPLYSGFSLDRFHFIQGSV